MPKLRKNQGKWKISFPIPITKIKVVPKIRQMKSDIFASLFMYKQEGFILGEERQSHPCRKIFPRFPVFFGGEGESLTSH